MPSRGPGHHRHQEEPRLAGGCIDVDGHLDVINLCEIAGPCSKRGKPSHGESVIKRFSERTGPLFRPRGRI